MIHNIEDGKKNIKRHRSDDFSGYLTEEELMKLIGHVEAEGMLHAPRQLKGNILEALRDKRRAAKKRQVFVYRAKVLTAMAAALAVLVLMPNDLAGSIGSVPVQQQAEQEDFEKLAKQRQKNRDDDWEKYLAERERGGVRGFLDGINEKVTQLGSDLYDSIGRE